MTSTSTSDRSSRSSAPLVVLFLRGGMDGLSLLRPTGDSELDRLRGPLAVAADSTVDVGDILISGDCYLRRIDDTIEIIHLRSERPR